MSDQWTCPTCRTEIKSVPCPCGCSKDWHTCAVPTWKDIADKAKQENAAKDAEIERFKIIIEKGWKVQETQMAGRIAELEKAVREIANNVEERWYTLTPKEIAECIRKMEPGE